MKTNFSFLFVLILSSQLLATLNHDVIADSAPKFDDAVSVSQLGYTVKDWMSAPSLKYKNIADLTLPGTHNSGTYGYKTAIAGKCQTLTISGPCGSERVL